VPNGVQSSSRAWRPPRDPRLATSRATHAGVSRSCSPAMTSVGAVMRSSQSRASKCLARHCRPRFTEARSPVCTASALTASNHPGAEVLVLDGDVQVDAAPAVRPARDLHRVLPGRRALATPSADHRCRADQVRALDPAGSAGTRPAWTRWISHFRSGSGPGWDGRVDDPSIKDCAHRYAIVGRRWAEGAAGRARPGLLPGRVRGPRPSPPLPVPAQ
jgi:hypothetical protein